MTVLRNLNVSTNGRRDSTTPLEGVLASEIPTGFPLPAFLLNDVDAGYPNRRYSLEILTLPSAGVLYLNKAGAGTFTGAPDGTYTGTQRVRKYDPGVGLASTADGTYSLTVGSGGVVTPPATAPAAPTGVTATAGNGTVSVTGTPGSNGGSAVISWQVVASTGQTATGNSLPVSIAMPNGVAATFQLRAINSVGPGALSTASNSVTPTASTQPPTPTVASVTLLPATATLAGGATLQLSATAAGVNPPQTFNWTRSPALGSVSSTGLVTAPMATSTEQTYIVTVASTLNPGATDTCAITVPALVVTQPGVKRTVNVTVLALDQQGNAMADADVTAVLDKVDIDETAGYVHPETITGAADDTGTLVLALWPNELGTLGSRYKFKIRNPDTGKIMRVSASIPNTDCFLHRVAAIPEQ